MNDTRNTSLNCHLRRANLQLDEFIIYIFRYLCTIIWLKLSYTLFNGHEH